MIIGRVIHVEALRYRSDGASTYALDEYVCTDRRDIKHEHRERVRKLDELRGTTHKDRPNLTGWTPGIGSSCVYGSLVTHYYLDMGRD